MAKEVEPERREPPPGAADAAMASIVRRWRLLTSGRTCHSGRRLGPGERTLVACSGGADSSALVLALAASTDRMVVAHILHDMRPAADANADCDAVRDLARLVGVPFVQASITVRAAAEQGAPRPTRNIEKLARDRRYAALAALARQLEISYIATGHQAQDQLETLLMRLMRGAGPTGLCGIACKRPISRGGGQDGAAAESDAAAAPVPPIWLIRPMLQISRADAEGICARHGWAWRHDATNDDVTRLRAALRRRVVPELVALSPGVEVRAAASVELLREAAALVKRRSRSVSKRALLPSASPASACGLVWDRSRLSRENAVILGELIRAGAASLLAGARRDRLGGATIRKVVETIGDESREPRRFDLSGIQIKITGARVEMTRNKP